MTGEMTLRGRVLKIGGLKEKVLAAHRYGIREIIIPKDNMAELEEVNLEIRRELTIHPVTHVDEVLDMVLVRPVNKKSKNPVTKGAKRVSRNSPGLPGTA
jgi:ATP-dependent Lon protease